MDTSTLCQIPVRIFWNWSWETSEHSDVALTGETQSLPPTLHLLITFNVLGRVLLHPECSLALPDLETEFLKCQIKLDLCLANCVLP